MIVMSIDIECKSRLKKIKNKFLKIPTVPMMTPMSHKYQHDRPSIHACGNLLFVEGGVSLF